MIILSLNSCSHFIEEALEDTPKTDDATNEKMDSDDSKAKPEG